MNEEEPKKSKRKTAPRQDVINLHLTESLSPPSPLRIRELQQPLREYMTKKYIV